MEMFDTVLAALLVYAVLAGARCSSFRYRAGKPADALLVVSSC
jgi:hypothetical protein